jgi:hypothetical protein
VYKCVAPVEAGARAGTVFTFSRPDGVVNVNSTWTCADEKDNKK